ncbi:hypothetical protein [Kordiimonas marina]|uniref:hypothetical protein n=1 Tax=Kordiimonas marina TaxID=2872312 RepID=UPI001FF289EF|nr:hypothetical protein [Kordiimonas marina]MCJ9430621.1 hypothetical protein [Kordiimonas marina]
MLIISDGQWQWVPKRSVTYTAICLTICTQLIVSAPVSAANIPSKDKSPARASWGKSRMGITAVVEPRCAIRVSIETASFSTQPVEVRCTQNTEYGLSVAAASGPEVTLRTAIQTVAADTVVPGGAGTSRYLVESKQVKAAVKDKPVQTILAIDF